MYRLIIVFLLSFQVYILTGGITSPAAIGTRTTVYPTAGENDPIFIFDDADRSANDGVLTVAAEDGSAGWSVNWFEYNPSNNQFEATGQTSATLSNLASGGYKAVLTKETQVEEYIGWVYNQYLEVTEARIDTANCEFLELSASSDFAPFAYYDPQTGESVALVYTQIWSSNLDGEISQSLNPVIDAPVEDVVYTFTVANTFGFSEFVDLEEYNAIAVEADFSFLVRGSDEEDFEQYIEAEGVSGPAEVQFTNESVNATEYRWDFGDGLFSNLEDPVHTYRLPDAELVLSKTYYAKMTASNETCESEADSAGIMLVETLVEVPNVFTPNNDGTNDEFCVRYKSLKTYEINIFNRWGNIVFSSKDPNACWDGRNNGKVCAPGVYFYVIRASGYNETGEKPQRQFNYEGSIHLFTSKK